MGDSIESYQSTERFAPFLRLETPRERVALPYATLLGMTLSADETTIELDFASRIVTVKGKRLHEVFCSIAAGRGEALFARSATDEMSLGPGSKAPLIVEIRIKKPEKDGG
jgi:hypothetical protein